MRVLVVEDDGLILMWVEDALRDAGYDVLTATSADQALPLLERDGCIDLVFTDIDMPGAMDGIRLAKVVRDRWPPVRIVIASGKHRPLKADMPGGAIFLPKPYLPMDMLGAISQAKHAVHRHPASVELPAS